MNRNGFAFIRNEKCFRRKNHDCGRYFGASKTCFIACPDSKKLRLVLDVITSKLEKEKIEPFIAVRERAYGEDIFCTKICGKIIESLFCMVILDDVENKRGKISPNPNVYYEYGMMTSMDKEIIPLQKIDGSLAFNIQSIEAIKYTEESLADEVEKAIRKVLNTIEMVYQFEEANSEYRLFIKKVKRILELIGCDKNNKYIENSWEIACEGTIFNPYMDKNLLFFAGVIERELNINDILAETRLLINRLDKIILNYDNEIDYFSKQLIKISNNEEDRDYFAKELDNNKWKRKTLDNVNIFIITMEEAQKLLKLIDTIKKIETKIKNINIEIWDTNKIEHFNIKLGLVIER